MGELKTYMKTEFPLQIKEAKSLLKTGNYALSFEVLPEIHKDIVKWSNF